MPSSHAAELTLIPAVGAAWVYSGPDGWPQLVASTALLLLVLPAVLECGSRVRSRLHTPGQVLVGAMEGGAVALLAAAAARSGRLQPLVDVLTWR